MLLYEISGDEVWLGGWSWKWPQREVSCAFWKYTYIPLRMFVSPFSIEFATEASPSPSALDLLHRLCVVVGVVVIRRENAP